MRRPRAAYPSVGPEGANRTSSSNPAAPFRRSRWGLDPPSISPGGSAYRTGTSGNGVAQLDDSTEANRSGDSWMGAVVNVVFQLVFWPLALSLMVAGTLYGFLLRMGCRSSPLRFRDPSRWLVRAVSKPFRLVNPPVALGTENLEGCFGARGGNGAVRGEGGSGSAGASSAGGVTRSLLLVGNQNLLGLDCVPILDEVQGRAGVYPRVLYDTLFGFVPGLRQLAEALGGVKGTMGNCEALMSKGRCLLLYPGGAREAFKRGEGDKYKLMWHEKLGFARMAVKHGYSVIPFASVGMEDAVSVAFGVDVTWLVRRAEPDRGPLRVPFLYPYNSLQRQYFAFGEPIETAHYEGDWENLAKCSEVYCKIKGEVERLILKLQQVQAQDPDRFLLRRAWRGCRRMLGGITPGGGSVARAPGVKA